MNLLDDSGVRSAVMKFFAALPLVLLAASCYYMPYDTGYPPYYGPPRNPGPRAPYGETGEYEPLPPGEDPGARPAPSRPTPPAPDSTPRERPAYPVAERTDNPNQVLSPYPPYNVIDVTGFRSGQLAKDPSNGKIFRIP